MSQNLTLNSNHIVSWCIRLSDGRIASADVNQTIKVWNVSDGSIEAEIQIPDTNGEQSRCMIAETGPNILAFYDLDALRLWKIDIASRESESGMAGKPGGKNRGMYPLGNSVVFPIGIPDEKGNLRNQIFTWMPQTIKKPVYHGELTGSIRSESHVVKLSEGKCAIGDSEGYVTIIDANGNKPISLQITEGKIEGIDRFDDQSLIIAGLEAFGYSVKKWDYATNEVTLLSDWNQMGQPSNVDGIKRLNDSTYLEWYTGMAIIDTSDKIPPLSISKLLKDKFGKGITGDIKQVAVQGETVAFATDKNAICVFNLSSNLLASGETNSQITHMSFFKDSLLYLTKNGDLYQTTSDLDSLDLLASGMRHFTIDSGILAWGDSAIFVLE